jgi:hypothetical protein
MASDLLVRIGSDVTGLKQGLSEATRDLSSFGSKARAGAGTMAAYGAAAAAAGAAVAAAFVVKGLAAVDAQAKLAKKLDTTSASLAVVKRAGDLAGASMGEIETGGKRLAVVLGQAEGGSKSAAATLDRLGRSGATVGALPLDQRILAVNQAIEANIPVTERAAVSAELFGKTAGFAIASLDAATMADAAKQVELFGLNLSDVDAARVEMANDAMSQIGMLVDGISQQLAVNLAPALSAVMRMFTETAEEAGGVGTSVAKASNIGIKAFGFLMDVIDGIRRAFSLAADAGIIGFLTMQKQILFVASSIINGPIQATNKMIELLNRLPGIDIEPVALTGLGQKIQDQIVIADGAIREAFGHMRETLERPMPSGVFAQYVEEAKVAAEEAAKVAATVTGGGGGGGGGDAAKGQQEKADAEAQYIADRLERLREANMTEMQLLLDKQMLELETINAGWEQKFLTDETWNELMRETKQRHEDELSAIEKKASDARAKIAQDEQKQKIQGLQQGLAGMSTLMNSHSRKQFEIGKAAGIANAIVNTYVGVTRALSELPPPVSYVAAAGSLAMGLSQVNAIRSQSFGGGAGAAATGSNTSAVNAASTPVGGGGGGPAGGTLTVQGLSASSLFSGDAVSALAEELLAYQRRGGSVLLAG